MVRPFLLLAASVLVVALSAALLIAAHNRTSSLREDPAVDVPARFGDDRRSPVPDRPEHFVAIGDSITGTGFHAPRGWAKQFAGQIGAGRMTNLAENGWTTGQLLFAVQYHTEYRHALRSADVITVNAGMNEFFMGRDIYSKGDCGGHDGRACLRHMVQRFETWWDALISEIRSLAPESRIIVINLYHPLEAFDQHFGWDNAVRPHLVAMNEIVADTPDVELVDVYAAFNGADGRGDPIKLGYILPDAIHATDDGHATIAALFPG
jgi:lysophospholipase L1-like esterase